MNFVILYSRILPTFAVEFIKEQGIMGKQQRTIPHGRYRLLDDKRSSKPDKLCAIYIEYSWNSAEVESASTFIYFKNQVKSSI